MRTGKVLKNSIYAVLIYGMTAVIAILVRRLFVTYLPIEFLGYEGLFGNIFSLLTLADLGVESLIAYRLYEAFAEGHKEEICRLMAIYKKIYWFVGIFILISGLILIPFLKWIIKENSQHWDYIYVVYILQLLSTLCTYFLAYKRILFIADQNQYKCTEVDGACTLASYFFQIVAIVWFKSYIGYLISKIFMSIAANCVLARWAKKEYGYAETPVRITSRDLKQSGLWHDIKNNIVQKVASVIWSSTDNIIITMLLGIANVGILSNFSMVAGYVTSILDRILNAFQASIGNLIYTDNKERGNEIFHMFNMLEFFLASFGACSYFILLNPLISLWLGSAFEVGMGYILAFALNQYVMWNHRFVLYYRNSFGKYEADRNYILAGAILNIVCSILLAKPLGIAGIMLGTVIGHVGFWVGRVRVVYQEYITEKIWYYVLRQIRNLLLLGVYLLILWILCADIPSTLLGFAEKMILCILIPNGINFVLFFRTKEMKCAFFYIRQVVQLFHRKAGS